MKSKGSVTIFTALIFLLIAAVITTSVQSVRIQAAKVMVGTSLSMALDSVFARYNRPLFDEWGVLLLDGRCGTEKLSEAGLAKEVNGYLEGNLDVTDGLMFSGGNDLYGIHLQGIELPEMHRATDDCGMLWMESIVEYERYEKVINLIASFMDIETAKENTFEWAQTGQKVYECMNTMHKIDLKAKQLVQYIDGVVIPTDGEVILSRLDISLDCMKAFLPGFERTRLGVMESTLQDRLYLRIRQESRDPMELCEEAMDACLKGNDAAAKVALQSLRMSIEKMLRVCRGALQLLDGIDEESTLLLTSSGELASLIQENEDAFGSEFTEEMTESIVEMGNYKEILAQDIMDVDLVRTVLLRNRDYLEQMLQCIQAYSSLGKNERPGCLEQLKNMVNQYTCEAIEIQYGNIIKMQKLNFKWLQTLLKYPEEGVFQIALPEDTEVSAREFGLQNRASMQVNLEGEVVLSDEAKAELPWKRVVYDEYVMDHFQNFRSETNGANLNYEVEYVLFGNTSDRKNLVETVNAIAGIRILPCLAYISTSDEKKSIAEEYATMMMEWTENEALIRVMKYVLLYLWAEREAASDCKILLSGGKVPLTKDDDRWQTGIESVVSLHVEPDVEANDYGQKYEDYLRALLLVERDPHRSAYTMDLIEGWMEETKHKGFRFKDQIYSMSARVLYSVRGGLYPYSYTTGYSY